MRDLKIFKLSFNNNKYSIKLIKHKQMRIYIHNIGKFLERILSYSNRRSVVISDYRSNYEFINTYDTFSITLLRLALFLQYGSRLAISSYNFKKTFIRTFVSPSDNRIQDIKRFIKLFITNDTIKVELLRVGDKDQITYYSPY